VLKAFITFLGGEDGEEHRIWLLLGLGFSMGVFLASYQVGAESLFLQTLGEEYLDKAFFTTGALGIISTMLFVRLQRRMSFSSLVIMNAFFIFLFVAGSRAAFSLIGDPVFMGFAYLPFMLFVMMGPITAVSLLAFWGLFGRMFDTRQAKRIIGGIDTGQLTATMIAFFSIPLITRLPFIDNTYDLLFVAGLAAFAIVFFIIWISITWNLSKSTSMKEGDEVKTYTFREIARDRYTRLLSIFLIFSVGAAVFLEYTYYSTVEIFFTDPETSALDEQKLNDFLSFFSGTIMIMSFLIQSFINDIIIGRFGLKIALMTMPVILILFTVGGIITGHIYGYEIKTEEFLLFFMFTVMAKAFTASLRDALESPAFKLFFLPFDIKIRVDVQTRIEGVINEFSTFIAGAAQILLGFLVFFKLIHYSYLILGLAGMVMFIAYRLYNQYKITLQETLVLQKQKMEDEGKRNDHNTLNVLKEELKDKDPIRVYNTLRIFERIDPIDFEFVLLDLLKHESPNIRKYAYQKLHQHECFDALEIIKREVKTEEDPEVLEEANKTVQSLEQSARLELTDQNIRKLVRSTEAYDRIEGARILEKMEEDRHLAYVIELLRDINPEVRMAAMETAGKLKRPELWPILVENLHLATYANAAMAALVHSGEAAFHAVDTSFYKTGQYQSTQLRIVQTLGRVQGRRATELLWKKIDYFDKLIVTELLNQLSYMGFTGRDFQAARIQLIIERLIGDVAWNIKVLQDIPDENPLDKLIHQAIEEENKVNYDSIFMLLAMIYDPQSVVLVKENLEMGSTDSITFAMEMMDIFCSDELKPKLLPVMDDVKDEEKLAKLLAFYPPEDFESYDDALKQIVNRDYNSITRYTKALALYRLHQLEGVEVSYDLIATLFHPDKLLLQTGAFSMYKLDKEAYQAHTKRLKPSVKKELDKAILPPVFLEEGEAYHQEMLLVEIIMFLKSIRKWSMIPGLKLSYVAEVLDEIQVKPDTVLIENGDSGIEPLYFVVEGQVDILKNGEREKSLRKGEMFGEDQILETEFFDYEARAVEKTTLLVFRKEELLDLMSKHLEVMEAYLRIMNQDWEKEEQREKERLMSLDIFNV
jgi:hypothetical protein